MSPTRARGPGQTRAFIDIGTNSVRLVVVAVTSPGSWNVVTQQKETVRLGDGEFGDEALLQPAAIARAAAVCARFADLARSHGAAEVTAVATAAVREAANRELFVRRLRAEAGLHVHVVSGAEEARLIFLGVLTRVHLQDERILTIDIGGGSTELAVGGAGGAEMVESMRLGAVRLTAEVPAPADKAISGAVYREMRRTVRLALAPIVRRLSPQHVDAVYGTSGSIVNLAAVAMRAGDRLPGREDVLERRQLAAAAKTLRALPLEGRRQVPGLNPSRADIVVAGAAILETVMDEFGVRQLTALVDCGLREGLVLDSFARQDDEGITGSVRERSVRQLAHALSGEDEHARHVARLATELFDSSRAAGMHRLDVRARELLGYAALLHDIGGVLSYTDHQRHTYYLIRNADLLGFDQSEISVMAATAYFHRKSLPRARHPEFAGLDPDERRIVRRLSLFVRLAEILDRGHRGAVSHAALARGAARDVVLTLETQGDWRLEQWGLERRRETLEKALGAQLTVRAGDEA